MTIKEMDLVSIIIRMVIYTREIGTSIKGTAKAHTHTLAVERCIKDRGFEESDMDLEKSFIPTTDSLAIFSTTYQLVQESFSLISVVNNLVNLNWKIST